MTSCEGHVVLVTGASAGIGADICKVLVKNGMKVIGAARRLEKLEVLANSLKNEKGELIPHKCDVTDDDQVYGLFKFIKEKYGVLNACVNNAGTISNESLMDGTPSQWRRLMDLNVVALCLCSQLAVKAMEEKGVNGYIINIGSISGHVIHNINTHHFYQSTKFAVRALTEGLRQEMKKRNNGIRVSVVSPGLVTTEILERVDPNSQLYDIVSRSSPLEGEDIGVIVLQMLTSPHRVEVNNIVVTPISHEM